MIWDVEEWSTEKHKKGINSITDNIPTSLWWIYYITKINKSLYAYYSIIDLSPV